MSVEGAVNLTRKEFEEAVLSGLKKVPRFLRKRMENVDVVIEDWPSRGLLEEMGLRSPYELLGLYQGVPIRHRGFYYGNVLPDKITLFQKPIEASCGTREEIEERVREVVIHEVGHYFGLDEETLRALERMNGER